MALRCQHHSTCDLLMRFRPALFFALLVEWYRGSVTRGTAWALAAVGLGRD